METNEYSTSSTIKEEPSSPIAYEDTLIGRDNHSNEVKSEEVDEENDVSVPCQADALCLREEIKTEELDISITSSEDEGIIHSEYQDFAPMTPKKECFLGQVPHTINSKISATFEIPQFPSRVVLQNPLLQGTFKGVDLFIKLPPKNLNSGEVLPNKLYREAFVQLGERIDKFQRKIKINQQTSNSFSNDECSQTRSVDDQNCGTLTSKTRLRSACQSSKSREPKTKSSLEQSKSRNSTKSNNCDQHRTRQLRGTSKSNDSRKNRHEITPTTEQAYKTEKSTELSMSISKIRQEDKIKTSVKTLTRSNLYTCDICMKSYSGRTRLIKHPMHTGEKPYSCKHCKKSFRRKTNSNQHLKVHTGERPYSCKHCAKSFRYKSNFNQHLMVHTGEKPYLCQHCKKSFRKKSTLDRHLRVHTGEKPYSCKHCSKTFRQKSHLNQHLMIHTGEKPYSCEYCRKAFSRKSFVALHLRTHTGEKRLTCKHCSKSFGQKSHLSEHLLTHTDERQFTCEHCKKLFYRKAHLTLHLRTHSGENPYACRHCSKSFSHISNRNRHERTHTCQ